MDTFCVVDPLHSVSVDPFSLARSCQNGRGQLATIIGVGGIALIVIIAAVIFSTSNTVPFSSDSISDIKPTLSVETDLSSYAHKDLISINGISKNSNVVNLSIQNQNNILVWAEQISVKNNGQYTTLAIAGGSGWETSGTYKITVDNGSETKSINFSFNS